jgi:large conductance mechanosensitive channel
LSEKQGVLDGFKTFLMRGNVVELAVAVVIGAAFSKIVDAVVKGFVNPLVGALGSKNLSEYRVCLEGDCKVDPVTGDVISGIPISWGAVVSATLTFLITAAVVYFLMVVPMNQYKARQAAKAPAPAPAVPTEVDLLTEIRDTLVAQRDGSADDAEGRVTAPRGGEADGGVSTGKK